MSRKPLYLFRFEHVQLEIPYTNSMIDIYPPWTYFIGVGSTVFYMFLIMFIFPMITSKLSSKSKVMLEKTHYTLLFFYSLFSFVSALFYIINTGEIQSWSNYVCEPVSPWLRTISISFTISKIWEWFDTAILISKGHSLKKIGFLHIYHHATTFLLFLCVMNFPGGEKSGMLLNGFVHTLMYYHFAYRLPKFLRPLITTLQIIQLMTVTYIWHIVPSLCSDYKDFPRENPIEFCLPYVFVPVYCLFFFKFFIEQYCLSSTKKSDRVQQKKNK